MTNPDADLVVSGESAVFEVDGEVFECWTARPGVDPWVSPTSVVLHHNDIMVVEVAASYASSNLVCDASDVYFTVTDTMEWNDDAVRLHAAGWAPLACSSLHGNGSFKLVFVRSQE